MQHLTDCKANVRYESLLCLMSHSCVCYESHLCLMSHTCVIQTLRVTPVFYVSILHMRHETDCKAHVSFESLLCPLCHSSVSYESLCTIDLGCKPPVSYESHLCHTNPLICVTRLIVRHMCPMSHSWFRV